jgi:hypothetical protein
MQDRELRREVQRLAGDVAQLRRRLTTLPVRFAVGGTGGSSDLPPGTGRYKVLMLIDDLDPANVDWDWPRFH